MKRENLPIIDEKKIKKLDFLFVHIVYIISVQQPFYFQFFLFFPHHTTSHYPHWSTLLHLWSRCAVTLRMIFNSDNQKLDYLKIFSHNILISEWMIDFHKNSPTNFILRTSSGQRFWHTISLSEQQWLKQKGKN